MAFDRLDELTWKVRADNPSPMTLDGTNTYLLGVPASGELVVVDPGPELPAHRDAVEAVAAQCDARIVAVMLTHHHADHSEAAGWAQRWAAPLWAFAPGLVAAHARPLADGAVVQRGGVTLEAVHTPGHCSDHLCLRVGETGAVLTGDHVLGRGTTVVAWPDGNMSAYLKSLDRLAALSATVLYPGHGPTLADPRGAVAQYKAHRHEREAQIVAALEAGEATPAQIVERVYADVDPALHAAAQRSVRAHLDKLVEEGRARWRGDTAALRSVDDSVSE